MALARTEVHVHFRRRSNTTPVQLHEVFWPTDEDMRGLSFRQRVEMYIFSWGDAKIQYPHVEISFSIQDVLVSETFSLVETTDTADELHQQLYRIGASAAGYQTFFQPRLYSSDDYHTVKFEWPEAYVHQMIRFAAANRQKPFVHGLFQTFLIPTLPDNDVWFCAQFITAILQAGRVMLGINPSEMTGDTILGILNTFYHASSTAAAGQVYATINRAQMHEASRPTRPSSAASWKMED